MRRESEAAHLFVGLWDLDRVELFEVLSELVARFALHIEVNLAEEDLARGVGDVLPICGHSFGLRVEAVGNLRHQLNVPQVHLEQVEQVFALHLDHDVGAVVKCRGVDLSDGRRCDRRSVESGEDAIVMVAEIRLDDLGHVPVRNRWDAVEAGA